MPKTNTPRGINSLVSDEELDSWLAQADQRIAREQMENGLTPEQWDQQERAKWRWASGVSRGMLQSAADLANDFNTGMTSLLGDTIQDWLAEVAHIGRRHDEAPYMGIAGKGAEYAGNAVALAGGLETMLTRGAVRTGLELGVKEASPSLATRVTKAFSDTAMEAPKATLAAEASGGFGAGIATEAARREGVGESGQMTAGLAGGLLLGAAPVMGVNFTRQALNWSLTHVSPWLDKGETLAAIRLQRLSANPTAAAEKVLKARPGLSPARASEDQNLLALEARILEDNPVAAAEFAEKLQQARTVAQQELRDFAGELRAPGEWERSVIERVAAPGAPIKMGTPQNMLEQAHKSFAPLYDDITGFPVKPHLETEMGDLPMSRVFKMNVMDDTILASTLERQAAKRILKDELSRLKLSTLDKGDGTIDSSKILTVRQNLRDRIRELIATKQRSNHITARILSNSEAAMTKMLEQQLPAEAMTSVSQIDDQYRLYQVVEQAVTTAGDRPMSPEALSQAVRSMMPGQAGNEMRRLARAGRDIDKIFGDPRAARMMVAGQKPIVRRQIQSDFFNTIWQRSLTRELNDGDIPLVSGERYLNQLVQYKAEAKALGIDPAEMNRAMDIARQIRAMEMQSPKAQREIIENGPASILQLLATMIGAKSGQRLAGAGMGSSMVMAQFGSQRARKMLSLLFRDDATDLLIKASSNKELYAALLTKSTAKVREQDKAAQIINAYLGTTVTNNDEDESRPIR